MTPIGILILEIFMRSTNIHYKDRNDEANKKRTHLEARIVDVYVGFIFWLVVPTRQ